MMDYRLLGSSGLRVSQLCLGAMTFGSEEAWCADRAESRAMFDAFAEAGGNFIDTADIYTAGESEKLVGEFIASDRERFVLATKYTNAFPGAGDPNAAGNHRKNLTQSLDASLKRLNVDYIDLYWVHAWDYTTPVEEVMRALDDAVSAGKILYVGLSDAPAWVAARANTLAEWRGWTAFVAMQLEYSLLEPPGRPWPAAYCQASTPVAATTANVWTIWRHFTRRPKTNWPSPDASMASPTRSAPPRPRWHWPGCGSAAQYRSSALARSASSRTICSASMSRSLTRTWRRSTRSARSNSDTPITSSTVSWFEGWSTAACTTASIITDRYASSLLSAPALAANSSARLSCGRRHQCSRDARKAR